VTQALQLPPRQRRDERADAVGGRHRRQADADGVSELLPFSPASRIQRRAWRIHGGW
jgi:hypothetical protein